MNLLVNVITSSSIRLKNKHEIVNLEIGVSDINSSNDATIMKVTGAVNVNIAGLTLNANLPINRNTS